MHKTSTKEVLQYLTIIAQPVRLDILLLLKQGEQCVCDIFERLHIAQNLASHHLRVMTEFGLLKSKKTGTKVLYTRNEEKIEYYQSLLTKTIQ